MIEINLLEQKKPFKMPIVLGVDLAQINYKALLIAIIISYVPDYTLTPVWEEEIAGLNNRIAGLNQELAKVQADIKGNEKIKQQLELFNAQVEKLKERSEQVKKIIDTRTNPRKILERVARNIPDEMWINEIAIAADRKVQIDGMSTSIKDIGNFITSANESSFFGKSLTIQDTAPADDPDYPGRRIEKFKISGLVEAYDPWQ
jgi:hypothetical protein